MRATEVRLSSVTNTFKVTFIHYSEGQMTENKTIIYTLLMSKLKHSTLEGERNFPSKLKNRCERGSRRSGTGGHFVLWAYKRKSFCSIRWIIWIGWCCPYSLDVKDRRSFLWEWHKLTHCQAHTYSAANYIHTLHPTTIPSRHEHNNSSDNTTSIVYAISSLHSLNKLLRNDKKIQIETMALL